MNARDELLRFERIGLEQADLRRDGLSRPAFLDMRPDLSTPRECDRAMSNEDVERAASAVAGPISVHIDCMFSRLPEGTSLEEVASALVTQIGAWSNHPEFVRFLIEALAARRALADRGVEF